jgi:phospholipase C
MPLIQFNRSTGPIHPAPPTPQLPPLINPTIGDLLSAAIDWALPGWSNANGDVNAPGWTNGNGQTAAIPTRTLSAGFPRCPDKLFSTIINRSTTTPTSRRAPRRGPLLARRGGILRTAKDGTLKPSAFKTSRRGK